MHSFMVAFFPLPVRRGCVNVHVCVGSIPHSQIFATARVLRNGLEHWLPKFGSFTIPYQMCDVGQVTYII